ncbi:MAG: hypothetical protein LBF91_06940 [Azoarcus sp.]|jgi:hypothetical protein|nr:hypothetical protein [Azoarcus sp.]
MNNHHMRKAGLFWNTLRAVALASVLSGAGATAQGAAVDVPDALKPWKAWALRGQEAWLCPEVAGKHDDAFCAWPGELKLEMREGGIQFTQTWEMRRESAAVLPGNREYWPQQVTVDGRPHPVLPHGADDAAPPVVWLTPGRHVLNGWIPWLERPQKLPVPKNVALISLFSGGKAVSPLARDETWLLLSNIGEAATERTRVEDSLDLQIYRKLSDGIPARLTTRVHFKVSGRARELSVPDILPPHFVPVGIASPWAARLDQEGRLLVQALPGQAEVEISARLDEPLQEVTPKLPPQREQEVWSYEAAPALRATAILPGDDGGAVAVDPSQAGVPPAWWSLPALAVSKGARLRVVERSRGQNERENQRLKLEREMWLDFSGKGFFARDRIEGSMRQGWRFDVARPYTLERADSLSVRAASAARGAAGSVAALLVTRGADERLTGIEWRQPQVTLNAGVRLNEGTFTRVPVTGWQQTFDDVDLTLHLPHGYRLLAAPGADEVSGNVWVEYWTILEIFLAAFFTLLAWRLFGVRGAAVAAAYLVLAMPEPSAPVRSFAIVVVLALLHRVMPEGRLRGMFRIGQYLALFCLVIAALVFLPAQIRYVLYPQLEGGIAVVVARDHPQAAEQLADAGDEAEVEMPAPATLSSSPAPTQKMRRSSSKPLPPVLRQRYAQSTVTQTGGGEPAWQLGKRYRLRWSGPVAATQDVRFLVSPPWLTRFLRLAMVALLGVLLWHLIRTVFPGCRPPPWLKLRTLFTAPRPPSATTAASLAGAGFVALLVAALGFPAPAVAGPASDFPPKELLDELKTRLLAPPECAPSCLAVAEARIEAEPRLLRVALTAHVGAPAALPLPEPDEHLDLRSVRVDGAPHAVLRFQGNSYVALPEGVRRLQIEYVPGGDTASLSFPLPPARVEFAGSGWLAEGIDESRLLSETLNFSRTEAEDVSTEHGGAGPATSQPDRASQQFPTFVHVRREIDLDLDWSVNTEVSRLAPLEGGFSLPIPVLAGEHVTTPAVKVQDGRALAVFAANAATASWTSRLDRAETLELVAPPLSERAETWLVTVNPSWHLEWNGVPVTLDDGDGDGDDGRQAVFAFHPLPGERLTLTVTQPDKVEGSVLAIDHVTLTSNIGQHASDYGLDFTLRASQGGEHRIALPPGLEVLDVQRGGVRLNLQARDERLSLPVSPGTNSYTLRLRQQGDIGLVTASPAIDLGLPVANVALHTTLGGQRWVLATGGPAVGPAVLYWGELLVALAIAFLLARSGWTSLGYREWFLLVLGFSTFSWLTLMLIALWLIVIDWRVRALSCASWLPLKFNAMQAGIAALTALMLEKLVAAIPVGLLGTPDMRISAPGPGELNWFADQGGPLLPVAKVLSLPIWVYRLLMLAWALWLAYILIRWLGRGLTAWLRHGYWKKIDLKRQKAEKPPPGDAAGEKTPT